MYETGLLLVCVCCTSAASVEHLPLGSRAVAFPRWLHVLRCSTCGSLFVVLVLVASTRLVFCANSKV